MKLFFKEGGSSFEVETNMDAQQVHALWVAAVKHGVHIQVPSRHRFHNIRNLDCDVTFAGDELLVGRASVPPPG